MRRLHIVLPYSMLLYLLYKELCGIWECCVFVLYLLGYSLVLYGFVCMELVLQGIGGSCVRKGGGTKYFTRDFIKYFTKYFREAFIYVLAEFVR